MHQDPSRRRIEQARQRIAENSYTPHELSTAAERMIAEEIHSRAQLVSDVLTMRTEAINRMGAN